MSYMKGMYKVTNEENALAVRPFSAGTSDKMDRIKRFLIIAGGMTLAIAFTLFAYFKMSPGHAVIAFFIFDLGGFYMLWEFTKRSEMKYLSVIVDDEGVHEIWAYPHRRIKKDILWSELKFCKFFPQMLIGAGTTHPPKYDCIVFSKAEQDVRALRAKIRKTWANSSMDYEMKFRKDSDSIVLVVHSKSGKAVYDAMLAYALSHNGAVVKDCDQTFIDTD